MREILCMFLSHKWAHIKDDLHQCVRCKEISVGVSKSPSHCGICGKYIGLAFQENDGWGICKDCIKE